MPAFNDDPAEGRSQRQNDVPGSAVCVYCRRRPVDPRWRPFCGERCQLQDLARWIDGDYRVAGESISPDATGAGDSDD
jgi:endogenous inhibitor of DNA gyrase (YacG/DUF329 family)